MNQALKRAIIEEGNIELLELFNEVSKEAKIEKHAVPPISRMPFWSTRKPLVVGKAMALASTLSSVEDVKMFLGLDLKTRAYKKPLNLSLFEEKIQQDPQTITVLDPFAGGGNLAFPALQLNFDVTVSDYNPLAHIIQRSELEFPPKYGRDLATDVEKYAKIAIENTEKEINKFFNPKHLIYFWCWCIKCPHCDQRIPLTNHMYLVKKKKKNIGIKIIPNNKNFTVKIIQNITDIDGKKFTHKGKTVICIDCKNSIDYKTMTEDMSKNKDKEMIAIQIKTSSGKDYVIAKNKDKEQYNNASAYFNSLIEEYEKDNLIPTENILPSFRKENTLWHYDIKNWRSYFSDRQLLVLTTFLKNIKIICNEIDDEKYKSIIAVYLTSILIKRVNMSGLGLGYDREGEKSAPVLSVRQPSIVYNFTEINPFQKQRGSFNNILKNIIEGILFSTQLLNSAKCELKSVTEKSDTKFDLILTDPPYGDAVQYGEISEYQYVWAYRALFNFFPELPSRVPLDEDFCESWGRFGNRKNAKLFFARGLKVSFNAMRDKLKDDGLLVVFFANSSTEVWNLFLESIRESKFKVVSSYSIHTEMSSSIISRNKASFLSSIVVVCRKILKPSEEYFEDLLPKITDKIKNMMDDIPQEKLLTLPITNLLILVYGKVLESCTQHTVLKSYSKDFEPNFETLIKDARSFIMQELIRKITGKSINILGPIMSFYLLVKIFHDGVISSDDEIKIKQTYNIKTKDLEKYNVFVKNKNMIRLFYLGEIETTDSYENVDESNLHQQLYYLGYIVKSKGTSEVQRIISKKQFKQEELKNIISLLIKNYNLKKNKGKSLSTQEQDELDILKTLADALDIKVEEVLDTYF